LDAERIHEEFERAPLIVEGVEHHADEVVVERGVAIAQIRADLARIGIACVEGDEELVAVLDEVRDGLDVGPRILARKRLDRELQGERVAPDRIVEHAVDRHLGLRVRDRCRFDAAPGRRLWGLSPGRRDESEQPQSDDEDAYNLNPQATPLSRSQRALGATRRCSDRANVAGAPNLMIRRSL